MAEGAIWEALDKASHYQLSNLIAIVDINRLGQRGATELGWDIEAYAHRVEAFGARAVNIDGHDLEQIDQALASAGNGGGSKPTDQLSIRFKSNLPWTRVENCPLPASTDSWSIWTHTWRPEAAGRYTIVLRVDDRSIRTRRLDLYFYARDVVIEQV